MANCNVMSRYHIDMELYIFCRCIIYDFYTTIGTMIAFEEEEEKM